MSRHLIKQLANKESKVYRYTVEYLENAEKQIQELKRNGNTLAAHEAWEDTKTSIVNYYKEEDNKLRKQRWHYNNMMSAKLIYDPDKPIPERLTE